MDWMSAINASIEGSPAQVEKHAKSFRKRYNRIVSEFCMKGIISVLILMNIQAYGLKALP
jgi:hypothetical protein